METTTIHPAEAYLRNEQNPTSLYVRIAGKRRRLFINRNENVIGIIALGKRKSGYIFTDWASIEKIYYPSSSPEDAADIEKKLVLKYQKLARLATHTNDWLRKIANADLDMLKCPVPHSRVGKAPAFQVLHKKNTAGRR